MCLNRPKVKEKKVESIFIKVKESTIKSKYEFLKLYYTKWNQITRPNPRVIIDTHAGTGQVLSIKRNQILKTNETRIIYGSPLLAILKTLLLSMNLTIILNEKSEIRSQLLSKCINTVEKRGLPIFEEIHERVRYRSLKTNRPNTQRRRPKREYPDSFDSKPPIGYQRIWTRTKAKIIINHDKIEDCIDGIFSEYLRKEDDKTKTKPKALFLVDPCGMVSWNDVILKICERSNQQEGTELILNWSWDAISRTLNTNSKETTLSTIYGIPLEDIDNEFEGLGLGDMEVFREKYIQQLESFFKYVVEVGVPRDRRLRPKQSAYRKYFLIFCTNNKSALSLAGYQLEKIEKNIRGNIRKISYYFSK